MAAKYNFGVRLSLEEGEKVKAALLALGETGQKALKGITEASAPASRGLQCWTAPRASSGAGPRA